MPKGVVFQPSDFNHFGQKMGMDLTEPSVDSRNQV